MCDVRVYRGQADLRAVHYAEATHTSRRGAGARGPGGSVSPRCPSADDCLTGCTAWSADLLPSEVDSLKSSCFQMPPPMVLLSQDSNQHPSMKAEKSLSHISTIKILISGGDFVSMWIRHRSKLPQCSGILTC